MTVRNVINIKWDTLSLWRHQLSRGRCVTQFLLIAVCNLGGEVGGLPDLVFLIILKTP